jgi:hypothetical protein
MPQHPTPHPLRRALAFGLDTVVIGGWAVALAAGFLLLGPEMGLDGTPAGGGGGHAVAFLTLTLPALVYLAGFEAWGKGATPGKRLLGLEVRALDGSHLSLGRALVRAVIRLLPWELSHAALWQIPGWPVDVTHVPLVATVLLGVAWLLVGAHAWALFRSRARPTPWDRVAGAQVVDRGAPRA